MKKHPRANTWHHAVVCVTKRHKVGKKIFTDTYFSIREIYHDSKGQIDGWSAEPRVALGDDLEGLRWKLIKMLNACTMPVLMVVKVGSKEKLVPIK